MKATSAQPGWYEDPDYPKTQHRYWNGDQWTQDRREIKNQLSNGWFVLAILVPISGLVLAIIEWSRGNTSRGFAFAAAGFLAFLIYALVTCGVAADQAAQDLNSYSDCVDQAKGLAAMSRC